MRKLISSKMLSILSAILILAIAMGPYASKATANESLGTTITCPEGDTYKCYNFDNGGIVYKGKGEVIITP